MTTGNGAAYFNVFEPGKGPGDAGSVNFPGLSCLRLPWRMATPPARRIRAATSSMLGPEGRVRGQADGNRRAALSVHSTVDGGLQVVVPATK
jgi:hypothetical protein